MARQRSNTVQPKPARRLVHKASASTSGDAQMAKFPLALSATTSIQTLSSDHRESLKSVPSSSEQFYTPDDMAPFIYISRDFVEALISDLQPTRVSTDAHHQINIVWDELILQLISHAQSLNPTHIRTTGLNGVFRTEKHESTGTKALAREAMSDAETEYRMFVGECYGKEASKAFQNGQGNGMRDDRDMEARKALDMLRHKIAGTLTCNSEPEDAPQDIADMKAFKDAGGMTNEMELAMCSVFLATLSEQIMLPIIKQMGEVVGRDSGSTTATASDLYTALSENESVWGFFKRFQCRYSLEDAIKPKSKRSVPSRLSGESKTSGRLSALAHPNGSDGSGISLVDAQMSRVSSPSGTNLSPRKRPATASAPGDKGISSYGDAHTLRKSPSMSSGKMKDLPERATSALSMNTRGMIGAWNDTQDADRQTLGSSGSIRSKREQLDEFDALMKNGETMKVSLTPNRLKTFDANGRHKKLTRGTEADLADTPGSSTSRSGTRKLEARDPRVKRDVEDEDTGKPFSNLVKRKETWMDLVAEQSEEVLQSEQGEKERLVPPIVLGTAPPRFSPQTPRRKEAMKNNPGLPRFELPDGVEVEKRGASPGPGAAFATLPRSAAASAARAVAAEASKEPGVVARDMARPSELGVSLSSKAISKQEPIILSPVSASTIQARRASGTPSSSPKKKTPAQEMADFFNSPPPPGFNEDKMPEEPPHSSSTVRSAPEKEKRKGLRGFMSRIGGGGKRAAEEPPSAYAQGISSADVFPPETKRISGRGITGGGGRYGSRSGSTNTAMSDAESQFNAQYTDSNGRFSAKAYATAMEAKKKQSMASLSSFAPTFQSVPPTAPAHAPSSYRGFGPTDTRSTATATEGRVPGVSGRSGLGISTSTHVNLGPPIGTSETSGASGSPTKPSPSTRYSTPNLRRPSDGVPSQIHQQPLPQPPTATVGTRTPSSTGTTTPTLGVGSVRRLSTISRKPVPQVEPGQSRDSTPILPENATIGSTTPGTTSNPPTAPGSVDSHGHTSAPVGVPLKGLGILAAPFESATNAASADVGQSTQVQDNGRRKSSPQLIIPEAINGSSSVKAEEGSRQPSPTPSSASRTKAALDSEQQLAAARTALAKAKAKARRLSSNGGDDIDDDLTEGTGTPLRSAAPSPVPSPGLLTADAVTSPLGIASASNSTSPTPSSISGTAPARMRSRRDISPGSASFRGTRPKTADSKSQIGAVTADEARDGSGTGKERPKSLQQTKSMLTSISADGSFRTAYVEPIGSTHIEGIADSVPEVAASQGEEEDSNCTARAGAIDSVPETTGQVTTANPATQEPSTPSVPHLALAPLHDLLRHATSVTECRLLISAFLLQLGIKPLGELEKVDPEQKVMAWLLGGGDGPFPADAGAKGSVPSELVSRAFAPAQKEVEREHSAAEAKGETVGMEEDKAESVSAHTERTIGTTTDAANTSGTTEDAEEPITPATSERPSTEAAGAGVAVKIA